MLAMLMLLQSVVGPPGDELPTPATATADCRGSGDEIVVCATSPEAYRLRPLPPPPGRKIPQASARVAPGVKLDLKAEPGQGYAAPVPRIMVGGTIAF